MSVGLHNYNIKLILSACIGYSIFGNRHRIDLYCYFSEQLLLGEVEISEKQDNITYVSLEVLQNVVHSKSKILLIDGRSESTYHEGHIPGAVNIPYIQRDYFLRQLLADVARETPIIVYCSGKNCNISVKLARSLSGEFGFIHVRVFEGGWEEWVKGKNPIQTSFDR